MAKSYADFTETDWKAFHAVRDALSGGVTFDDERLEEVLAEVPDESLRDSIREAAGNWQEAPDEAMPHGYGPNGGWTGTAHEQKVFDIALYRIVHGLPGVINSLATVTGLSVDAIKCRVHKVKHECPDEADGFDVLNRAELSQLGRRYGANTDPKVRDFLTGLGITVRQHPDHRSRDDWNGRRAS